jgi:hypothetical protein
MRHVRIEFASAHVKMRLNGAAADQRAKKRMKREGEWSTFRIQANGNTFTP